MQTAFPKEDSLKLFEIEGIQYIVGETEEGKCDYCKLKTIPHRVVLGKYTGEQVVGDKNCMCAMSFNEIFVDKKQMRELLKLNKLVKRRDLDLCAIRVYTPYGSECLEEIGDFSDFSIHSGEILKEHTFFEAISKKPNL